MKYYLILFFLCFLVSCQEDFEPIPFEHSLNLPTEYAYEVTIQCFCPLIYRGPHMLHIKGDQVIDYALKGSGEISDTLLIITLTIDSLTSRVNSLMAQDPVQKDIELHPVYNFPEKVFIDLALNISDEEWGYEIKDFTVIQD